METTSSVAQIARAHWLLRATTTTRALGSVAGAHKTSYDVAILGGGIVGLATARELSLRHPTLKLAVLEKEDELAVHQSGHNSGVIHSGIYYTPGSLKAKLCVKGADMIYAYCEKNNIPCKRVGKVIVAVRDDEIPRLRKLYERGVENGVKDLRIISPEELREIEPHCQGKLAIHSPNTGIVDYAVLARSYAEQFKQSGGHVHTGFEVNRFTTHPGSVGMTVGIHAAKKPFIEARYVIACTGLYSDRVAQLSGCGSNPSIVPFRGEYLLLKPEKSHLVRGNIYPVPDPQMPFLGFHFTPRMDGEVWLGPNAVLAFAREGYQFTDINLNDLSEALRFSGLRKLMAKYWRLGASEVLRSAVLAGQVKELQRYVPDLKLCDVKRGPAGVRAMAMETDGSLVDDFVFDQGKGALSEHILHVRNAPSPAATSSLALAEIVADKAAELFKWSLK